jgi:anti-sigma regulatory factor (Ser/Thr protein kinase)
LSDELAEDVLLVVSELVTNAIRHGRPDVVLGLEPLDPGLRILVSDCGEALPIAQQLPPDPDAPSGRGLLIVASTAAAWGVRRNDGEPGKTVWADLRGDLSPGPNGRRG